MKLPKKALIFSIILTFVLFALPYFLSLPNSKNKTYMQVAPEEGKYIQVNGYETFVVEKNPAARETIILVHGFAGNHLNWRNSIEKLKNKGYRVVAIDLINFGFSERDPSQQMSHSDQAQLIKKIMDRLQIQEALFVGHSMGGSVITHFYNQYPEKVKRLIYVSPAINTENKYHSITEFILRMPGLERWFRIIFRLAATEKNAKKLLDRIIINKEVNIDDLEKIYVSYNNFQDWDLGIINANYTHQKNLIDISISPEIPICIIWGTQDEIVKRGDFDELTQLKHSELIEMEAAGHLPFEDYPQEFNKELLYCIGNLAKRENE